METNLYNPFNQFLFDNSACFLTGNSQEDIYFYPVFPSWILEDYGISDQPFKMLDESFKNYSELKVPCTLSVYNRLTELDDQVHAAFKSGYEGLNKLDKTTLFQWIGKWVYGIIFNEIQAGIRQQALSGEPINFSQALVHKFKNLHSMLQSIVRDVEFENMLPFSIRVFEVDNPEHTYNYRDEINTLVFSLRIKNLGIVACLQDNGTNEKYHSEVLSAIEGHKLHPIQFEELCARFFYSCYLFNRLPEYMITEVEGTVYVEPMSLLGVDSRPIFDNWQVKTYGQVLENFWKPWGLTLFEIIKDPDNPVSFLTDKEGNFIPAEQAENLASSVGG